MRTLSILDLAAHLVGVHERPGPDADDPFIVWALSLCTGGENQHDETPWCSAAQNALHYLMGLPRTHSLRARSWLAIGDPIPLWSDAKRGDVVILSRGSGPQPGPMVLDAPGHVGTLYRIAPPELVWLYGGNQENAYSLKPFPQDRILGIRRF